MHAILQPTPPAVASTAPPSTAPDHAAFLRAVLAGVDDWVRHAVERAAEDLASSSQRLAVAGGRQYTAPALTVLHNQREELIARLAASLRHHVTRGPESTVPRPAASAKGALTLIDEAQIDEEIETARIVQIVESEADAELQELNALCSSLRRLDQVDPKAAPLRPLVCAQALREALAELPMESGTRLLLLRSLGTAVGKRLRNLYAEQAQLLNHWGVQPASFRIRHSPSAEQVPPDATRPGELSAPDEPAVAAQSMQRLVQWAQRATPTSGYADPSAAEPNVRPDADSGGLTLRLLVEPEPTNRGAPALASPEAEQLMHRLFSQLGAQGEVSPAALQLVQGLEWAGRELVKHDPALWSKPGHPWWALIDRLLAVGAVHEDLGEEEQGSLHASLNQVVNHIQQAPQLDMQVCQQAADEVQAVASRLLEGDAGELLGQVGALQYHADQEETEAELRNQLVQQLRATPVCAELRRFLVGPWTQAMAVQAQRHGPDSKELTNAALVVDDLIRATSKPGQRVSSAQRAVLLRQVNDGLLLAGLPESRVKAEVMDLKAVLRDPPALQSPQEAWTEAEEPVPAGVVLDLHAGLPTVPMDMGAGARVVDTGEWAGSLEAGAYCQLFLQGHWVTAQLRWVSPSRNLFLFNSRHGGRAHSLTRRMLQKLRSAGLATHIQDGFLLAQAMDTLLSTRT